METITEVIHHFLRIYAAKGYDAYSINNGRCEDFAVDVINTLGGESDELYVAGHENMSDRTDNEDLPGHCFICYMGRFYDSQAPCGVDQWRQLPIFASA